ncbi:acylphosphatase [Candidatus Latescibacterota bacterium]
MPDKAVHMIVHGRVQGVGFRFFVRDQAAPHGIKGWVKNLPNGTVEIFAGGEKENLDNFIKVVNKGPFLGYVSELTLEWVEPTDSYTDFRINF